MDTADSQKISIRRENARHPLVLLPTRVNGRGPFTFVLDTGASSTLVTPEMAELLGLERGEKKRATGARGETEVVLSKAESIEVAGETVKNAEVAIRDLRILTQAIGEQVDGDLGYSFLRRFAITIDYPEQFFSLTRTTDGVSSSASPHKEETRFRLANPEKPLILIPVRFNDGGQSELILDTGAGATVLSPELARSLGVQSEGEIPMTGAGDGAKLMGAVGAVPSLTIGPAKIENLQVLVADMFGPLSKVVGTKLEGIVGHNFLRNFRVTIDYPRQTLRLE
jgi:predicted aspartyl protease